MNAETPNPTPFGRRFGHSSGHPIEADFPEASRAALIHIIRELVELGVTVGWYSIILELERLARVAPFEGREEYQSHEDRALQLLRDLPWVRVFEFCERMYAKLLQPKMSTAREPEELISLAHARNHFSEELNRLVLEDNFAYSFSDGSFRRPGSRHFQSTSSAAQRLLVRPELRDARSHYGKAMRFFDGGPQSDYPNAVKESVAALEAAIKALFSEGKEKDVRKILQRISGTTATAVPPTLSKAIDQLYSFRGAGAGVAHGGAEGGVVTAEVAELVMTISAGVIVYLVALDSRMHADLPF